MYPTFSRCLLILAGSLHQSLPLYHDQIRTARLFQIVALHRFVRCSVFFVRSRSSTTRTFSTVGFLNRYTQP
ncbi:hypothetical protein FVER53590_29320 [Fusarium verticillioides]|nr:hypothetical protein FVER53590_29320 [Fusarium verticillioides]